MFFRFCCVLDLSGVFLVIVLCFLICCGMFSLVMGFSLMGHIR